MKKLFTKLSAALLTLGCLFAAPVVGFAQFQSYNSQPVAVPATIANATTTNLATPLFIDAHAQQYVGFQLGASWSAAGESTGSTNILYTLAPTVDGTHYDTNKTVTLAAYEYTAAGVTSYSVTNLSANGYKGWYVIKAVNNSSGTATNGTSTGFVYSLKLGAP